MAEEEEEEEETKALADEKPHRKLSLLPLVALIFYEVSGGPFGIEDSVRCGGPLLAILGFIIFPLIWSLPEAIITAELSTAFPFNGSCVLWISEAFGPKFGFQAGYWKWLSGVIDNALYPVLFLDYIKQSLPIFAAGPVRIFSIIFITALLTYLNYRGLTVVGYTAVALAVFSLLPFALLGILAIPMIEPRRWFDSSNTRLKDVKWRGFLNNLFWNLNSWDKASSLAGEVEKPSKNFPKALFAGILVIVIAYLVPLVAGTGAVDVERWKWEDGYLAVIGMKIGGNWLRIWIQAAAALSNMGLFEAEMSGDSFQLQGMAEKGMLPKLFALKSRYGSPIWGIAFSAFGVLFVSWLRFDEIVEFLNFLYGMGMLVEIGAFVYLRITRDDLERPYKAPFGNRVCIVMCLLPVVLITIVLSFASLTTLVASLVSIVFGLLLHPAILTLKRYKWMDFQEQTHEYSSL